MMKKLTFLFFAFNLSLGLSAQVCMPALPDEKTQDDFLVYDFADFLPDGQEKTLNQKLVNFYRETSNQILVVVPDTLCGYEPWEYATRLGHSWGLGNAEKDNGIVVMLKPKTQGSKGQIHIATGYGLEGAIPDVYANRISNQVMIPSFKQNKYMQGLNEGTDAIMDLAKGEHNERVAMIKGEMPPEAGIFVIFVLLLFGLIMYNYHRRVEKYAEVNTLAYWTAFWMLMNQHGHSGRFDDFNRGSGPFRRTGGFGGSGGGSGGGGGFGGFGGGGFGGGGAGGSW